MMIIYFFYGLSFGGLGLAAYLQLRRGGDFPLRKLLPWLAAFGFACGATGWIDMFLVNEVNPDTVRVLEIMRTVLQPVSGLLLFIFGWGIFAKLLPLPRWMIFVPGILIVPFAYVITYALSTFVTPSPIEIPIDIWSRYLLYLPGSILAGAGFLRQWSLQRKLGYSDVANLMLGAGIVFLIEAFVMGLVVPAAPYGPASYYNYDRVAHNAFSGEAAGLMAPYGLSSWLDYQRVLEVTGLPIQFWRMVSAMGVTFFVVRGLDVFEAIQKREMKALQDERDHAQQAALDTQISARQAAESWTEALVNFSSRIAELEDVDRILLYIVESTRKLFDADFMGLALVNGDSTELELKYFAMAERAELVEAPLLVENAILLNVLSARTPYHSHPSEPALRLKGASFHTKQDPGSLAAVPLQMDAQPFGVMWVARSKREAFSETDMIWLECLADQVVIAVKHGLMTSQIQSLSVIEERARIGREMHDGLAQVLGYMNLQVQTIDAYLQQGKLDKLQEKLTQMRQAVQSAHADVRENILSLRTTLANEKGLIPAIEEYLVEFGIQTGIETSIKNTAQGDLSLASIAEVQLVCILQEALTNVRKHAHAKHIDILINKENKQGDEWVVVCIKDNGMGFDTIEKKRHFGLQTMRERAESVNGSLLVSSNPGIGTEIDCRLPCLRREQMQKPGPVMECDNE